MWAILATALRRSRSVSPLGCIASSRRCHLCQAVELTAAKLISETANVDRFRSEAAFARYVGIAPVPMWSGSTEGRLRVSRSGNRQLNTALHRIAVVQIRLDCAGRDTADADAPKAIPV
jgi:transposase